MIKRKISNYRLPCAAVLILLITAVPDHYMNHSQAAAPEPATAYPVQTPLQSFTYTVRTGDSLYRIARDYQVSINALKKANRLVTDQIYVGQTLIIPNENGNLEGPSENPSPIPPSDTQPAPLPEPTFPNLVNPVRRSTLTIDKTNHTLTLSIDDGGTKTYPIALGDGGPDDKDVSGDHKTPEGEFYITEKTLIDPPDPIIGSRWIRLSYPNAEDAERGWKAGLIDKATRNEILHAVKGHQSPPQYTALGSAVGIHGGNTPAKGSDWTWGSAAMSNADIEELFEQVQVGTVVIIKK